MVDPGLGVSVAEGEAVVRPQLQPLGAKAVAVIDRQLAEGAWSYGVLYDVRAGHASPSAADVHELVKHVGRLTTQHGPRGRVALVVLDPALSKMARRYASLGELTALNVRVFTSIREAERWLDLGRA